MRASMNFHSAKPVASRFRFDRKPQVTQIDLAIGLARCKAARESCFATSQFTPAIVDSISCDRSTRQVLSIVHPGGIEGNTILLGGQSGPIYSSVLPAHEADEILVRDSGDQTKWFSLSAPNHRSADQEHSSFIRSIPVILAAIALFFAGSYSTQSRNCDGFDSSGSQIIDHIRPIPAPIISKNLMRDSSRLIDVSLRPAKFWPERVPDLSIRI